MAKPLTKKNKTDIDRYRQIIKWVVKTKQGRIEWLYKVPGGQNWYKKPGDESPSPVHFRVTQPK